MSLYAINQLVWCRSQKALGTVQEANYTPKAHYLVSFGPNHELLTGSSDLRAADWCCDGCDRWLPGRPYRTSPDGEHPHGLHFCFLCVEIPT